MNTELHNAGIYTSFNGLAELKSSAHEQSPQARKEVARQFEALFIQIMLKSMRDASAPGSDGGSDQLRFYQEMFDQQIALDLARNKSMGLAESFERHLEPAGSASTQVSLGMPDRKAFTVSHEKSRFLEPQATEKNTDSPTDARWVPATPEEFVQRLWPAAREVAQDLGLEPDVLVAQAALETGWGKNLPTDDNGSSMNLFGIKADARWQGKRVGVSTLEYREGRMVKERADFRSYASPEESLGDYARFLKDNPRYERALENTGDSHRYLEELQKAGYATDPDYARKIKSIMDSERFMGIVGQFKTG